MTWLLFLFVTGVRQTGHTPTCRLVGLALHFLSVSSLLWVLTAVHIVYTKVAKKTRPPDPVTVARGRHQQTSAQPQPPEAKMKRPITRFYLFGYGVSLMVVAVSAAIDVQNYATGRGDYCFLKFAPFLGALVVPASLAVALILGFSLASFCILYSAPSHVTEQIEFVDRAMSTNRINPNTGR